MSTHASPESLLPTEEAPSDGRTFLNASVWFVDRDGYRVVLSCLRRNWTDAACGLAQKPRGGFSRSRSHKNCTPEEKVAILKRHLVDKVPGCDLCDELGLNPTVFY